MPLDMLICLLAFDKDLFLFLDKTPSKKEMLSQTCVGEKFIDGIKKWNIKRKMIVH